jgi:hypothetical protein
MTDSGRKHTLSRNDLIDLLIDMRLNQGYSREGLKKFLMAEPYKYAENTARIYVADAAKEFENRAIVNFGDDLKEDIERFESDRFQAISRGDFKQATHILEIISKLKGHFVERIEMKATVETAPVRIIFGDYDETDTTENTTE